MAIWQFHFYIIPGEKGMQYHSVNIKAEKVEAIMSWQGFSINDTSILELSKVLKPSKSWTVDIKLFGDIEQSCVELFYDGAILIEASIRIDLRDFSLELLEAVVDFIRANEAMILTNDGFIVSPNIKDLMKEIINSQAYAFMKNPERFLAGLDESI
jgi:hypothetical protein